MLQNHATTGTALAVSRLVAIFGLALFALPLWAQGGAEIPTAKVAVIDVQRIIDDSQAARQAMKGLEDRRDEMKSQVDAKASELQELKKQLDEGRLSLSEERLAEMSKEFEDKKIGLQRFADDSQRQLQKEQEQVLAGIEDKVLPIIDEVRSELGLTLVFSKYQSGLLSAADEVDITDLILRRFDQSQAEGE